jgi:small GTP-binding protein
LSFPRNPTNHENATTKDIKKPSFNQFPPFFPRDPPISQDIHRHYQQPPSETRLPMALLKSVSAINARVVVIGDSTVGKTSILNQLVSRTFNPHQSPTVVSNFQYYAEDVGGTGVELQIWDTAGQEKFRSLGPIYFRNASAAIAVYDRTSRESFEHLTQWIDAFIETAGYQAVIAVAGNKLDLDDPQIELSEAEDWAKAHNYIIVETSAVTGTGIQALFRELVDAIVRSRSNERFIGMSTENEPKPVEDVRVKGKDDCC